QISGHVSQCFKYWMEDRMRTHGNHGGSIAEDNPHSARGEFVELPGIFTVLFAGTARRTGWLLRQSPASAAASKGTRRNKAVKTNVRSRTVGTAVTSHAPSA